MAEGASPKGNMPPDTPDRDPVTSQSLSRLLLISALLLVAALAWALYDEFFGLRPWKNYQRDFVGKYSAFLKKEKPKQEAAERAIRATPEYQALQQQLDAVSLNDGKTKTESVNYDHLEGEFKALQAKKGELLVRKGEILRPVSELRAKQDSYFQQHLNGLTSEQIQGLIDKTRTMSVGIK